MIRAHCLPALAAAALLTACSTMQDSTTYYAPGAAPLPVAGSTATYSAGTGTVASGVNTFSSGDRVVVGEAAAKTTTGESGSSASPVTPGR